MTEEESAEGFEKKEPAPPFLQYLITHDLGNLPRELRGETINRSGSPLSIYKIRHITSGQIDLV